MNKRKVTKGKSSKSKKKNDQAEVFVLPPNLLEELGINLGSIESTPEPTRELQESDKYLPHSEKRVEQYNNIQSNNIHSENATTSEKESSIIQTANLMKASVFLSPTFIPNNTSTIQGEFEVVANNYSDESTSMRHEYNLRNYELLEETSFVLRKDKSPNAFQNSSSSCSTASQDTVNDDQLTDVHALTSNIDTRKMLYDEHADEAYSSDCSNSNIDKAPARNSSNCCEMKQNVKKKINIISEQILNPSQYQKLSKCCSPKGNKFIPVTMNTFIKSQYNDSVSYENSKNNNICVDPITDCVKRTEKIDGEDIKNPTEIDKHSFSATVIKHTIPEIIDNSDSHNTFLYEKEDDLRHVNEQLRLHTVQQNNDNARTIPPCAVDNGEKDFLNKPDVFIELFTKSTETELLFEEEKVSESHDNQEKVNEFSLNEQNCHEHCKNIKSSSPYISTPYTGDKTRKCSRDVISTDDGLGNRLAKDDSNFNPSHIEFELNVEKQDIKLKNKKISSKDSKGIIPDESFMNNNTNTETQEEKCIDDCDKQHSKMKINGENNQSKIVTSENDICGVSNLHSTPRPKCGKITTDGDLDKIKEIAKYLNEFAEIQKRKTCNVTYNSSSIKTLPNKKYAANSKLSIQGVEKPGGSLKKQDNENDKNVRTYARVNKCTLAANKIADAKKENNFSVHNIDLIDTNKTDTCNENYLCLCGDFGRFISYDILNIHENICFCSKNEAICTPDVIFSIFYEEANFEDNIIHKESGIEEEFNNYVSNVTMSCDDDRSPVSTIEGSEHVLNNVTTTLKEIKTSSLGGKIVPETSVCCSNPTSVNDFEICGNTTNAKLNPEPGDIPKRQKRKQSLRIDDGCEAPLKKRQVLQFSPKHGEITKKQNAANEEYAVEKKENQTQVEKLEAHTKNSHDKNQFATSCDDVSKVGSLIDHGSAPNEAGPVNSVFIKCGVCEQSMQSKDWIVHIESEHNYLAWKHGEQALDLNIEKTVRKHLCNLINEFGGLKCAKCGLIRKFAKSYLAHVQRCGGVDESHETCAFNRSSDSLTRNTRRSINNVSVKNEPEPNRDLVKCGVCGESMQSEFWMRHIELEHNYLAWKSGQRALDVNDKDAVREHLYDLTKEFGGLKCAKCGITRKYVKSYLTHIRTCDGSSDLHNASAFDTSSDTVARAGSVNTRTVRNDSVNETVPVNSDTMIQCGVCDEAMNCRDWQSHIESRHQYLAWKSGEPALDLNNEEVVREHLYGLTKELGGLKCSKCGVVRKYVKSYLTHIQDCSGLDESHNAFDNSSETLPRVISAGTSISDSGLKNEAVPVHSKVIQCGACDEAMHCRDWHSHIESQHQYLAWKNGEPTFDLNNEEAVREHLYGLTKELGGLKCAKCGVVKKYVKSYLTHVQRCNVSSDSRCSLNNVSDIIFENESHQVDSGLVTDISGKNQEEGQGFVSVEPVTCGVCGESVHCTDWHRHIESRHDYLAWKHGEPTLDVNCIEAVHEHLYNITKMWGPLKCSKCSRTRKYVKSYLNHFKSCSGPNESQDDSKLNATLGDFEKQELVKCGVCAKFMQDKDWIYHIRTQHDYLAWKLGEPALDVDDKEAVREHLYGIVKEQGDLQCSKCGVTRRYVKSYLTHLNNCSGPIDAKRDVDSANSSMCEILLDVENSPSKLSEELIKCGTCGQYMVSKDWTAHIADQHQYLAWKASEPSFDLQDESEVQHHLQKIVEKVGSLMCSKCGMRHKQVKSYMQHMQTCNGPENSTNDSTLHDDSSEMITDELITPTSGHDRIKCGVCGEILGSASWISHIAEEHKYLAWKEGDTPLDVNDKDEVFQHLKRIITKCGVLTCKTCDKTIKLAKTYLQHIETCDQDFSVPSEPANISVELNGPCVDFVSGGTCGVCRRVVAPGGWIQHTQKYHNYLAWRDGEKPWDVDDFTEVNERLYIISKKMNGLICNKCGLVRKYVKSYLTHIKNCTGTDDTIFSLPDDAGTLTTQALYQCAMCKEKIEPEKWKNHAMKEHYNITWIVGQTPVDIKNPYAVERYIKEYKNKYGLKCKCGASRVSCAGFYAHIITCGKTEEQIEMFKSICDICNNSYLCIYKNQHMAIHRVQEYKKELKLKKLEAKQEEDAKIEEIIPPGKRRAAQKARSVIENYSNDLGRHTFKCESCGFSSEFGEELKAHKCETSKEVDFSSGESSSEEEPSGNDSAESAQDSDEASVADEQLESEAPRKKRYKLSIPRLPFQVTKPTAYFLQADEDFCNAHFTGETLFPQWNTCDREMVPEYDLSKYLPPIEQSCKVKSSSSWTTLKRFEALKGDDIISMFVGACIVSISWIPLRVDDIFSSADNFLAIVCHNGADEPRYECEETPSHENLIQIWQFNTQSKLPKIVLGIAHDFGIVWSMDWCPSGARDVLPEDFEDGQVCRLGLLAVACSNGSAYIFSVPYPSTVVKNDEFIFKLKPVAELRMTMKSTRKLYQATSINWSKEKGHTIVLVGYSDGSTAYYDLSSDSPLLREVDNNIDVFYPYHDERPLNSCITATDMYPSALSDAGAAVTVGATGAEMSAARRGAGGARARYSAAGRAAAFTPHWPAAMLAGDAAIVNTAVNEVELGGAGRRLGGARALAGCARCAAVVAAAPPALRLLRLHPAYPELHKQVIGMLEMTRLDNKRSKQVNDELAMQVEPITYADAVKTYGIEFKIIREVNRIKQRECSAKPRAHYPERFPLADVKSMAFCPSWKYHDRLAIATHSGIVLLMNVRP